MGLPARIARSVYRARNTIGCGRFIPSGARLARLLLLGLPGLAREFPLTFLLAVIGRLDQQIPR